MLNANNSPSLVLSKAVEILQGAAQEKTYMIVSQCNSAVIPRSIDSVIVSTYHSAHRASVVHAADVVVAVSGCVNACADMKMGWEDMILTGPTIRKNEDCWCGSGKKFKVCHFKKFGSTYARLPGYHRPMAMTFAIQRKTPVAIGHFYCVQSAFN